MSRALGRYELLRPLARGGMAEVFLARRRAAGVEKWLVVKRIRAERAGDARFLDLFVREARLSMSLAHQNIVPVFDFGRIDDQVFLAMERVEGRDLGSTLARSGKPVPPVLAAFIATECLQALDYAHRRRGPDGAALGIVHRDVTPRNVLLSWSGEVKLTDFGIAALAGEDASAHKMIGTPAYMAPEQARNEALDPRADIYSVGMVLREALTGVRARPGEERESIVAAAKRAELVPWPEGFESPLREVCEKATAALPSDRYDDARDMLEALDEFIVAARAGSKDERRAPARQLAGWLDAVWKDERDREDAAAASGEIEGDHLVSFMDDGELDVMGTGTARSLAATASEVVVAPVAKPEPPKSEPKKEPSRVGWWIAGVAAFAAASAGAIAVVMTKSNAQPAPDPAPAPAPAPAPVPVPVPVPATGSATGTATATGTGSAAATATGTATGSAAGTATGTATGAAHPPLPHPPPHTIAKIDTPPPPPPPTPAVTFKATINISPWANFTVDSSPTQYTTPATLELAPGPHQIHFSNPPLHVEKTSTLDMPAHDFKWLAGKLQD